MGLFTSINIAATGMSVERLRSDVISNNIANAFTTRTQEGGAFHRSRVVLAPVGASQGSGAGKGLEPVGQKSVQWRTPYSPKSLDNGPGAGVKALKIVKDTDTATRMVYDPGHPDAIQSGPNKGYVEYPNVNIVDEMVDLISASRAYEANATVVEGAKEMFSSALDIGRV